MLASALSSFFIKKISPRKIICMFFWALFVLLFDYLTYFFQCFSGSWMLISSLCCFAINFLTNFNAIVTSFIMFLSCCSCANIVMAVAVNLFPTNYKGMATAFILMCGRLGGFAGSNLVGILLAGTCTSIFYVNGGLLLSKNIIQKFRIEYKFFLILFRYITLLNSIFFSIFRLYFRIFYNQNGWKNNKERHK